jgi:hypothetical protein
MQGQFAPAQVLQIIIGSQNLHQVLGRRDDPWRVAPTLKRQERDGSGSRNRLGQPAENMTVAIIDAAGVVGAVEQQAEAFLDTGMTAIAGAAQGQAGPRCRFDPSKIILGPGPAAELNVDIVHFRGAGVVRNSALERQQIGSGSLDFIGRVSERGLDE